MPDLAVARWGVAQRLRSTGLRLSLDHCDTDAVKVVRDRLRTVNVKEFLARPLFAHLSTDSAEGPRESPVWFLWEDEALWILGSRRTDTFPLRIEREPRCAVGIVDFDRQSGRVQHVRLRGQAAIEPFDAGRARRLLSRYLGDDDSLWDERFRRTLQGRDQDLLVRFVAETAVARDVSYEISTRAQSSAGG
jgi:Pyridoxamine 5'-phosphate oxidase